MGKEREVREKSFQGSIIFLSWLYEFCWAFQSKLLKVLDFKFPLWLEKFAEQPVKN